MSGRRVTEAGRRDYRQALGADAESQRDKKGSRWHRGANPRGILGGWENSGVRQDGNRSQSLSKPPNQFFARAREGLWLAFVQVMFRLWQGIQFDKQSGMNWRSRSG
ncbi:hypothetical protein GCM10009076_16560 [Erythrobacter ramosus]